MIVRVNTVAGKYRGHPGLPYRLGIAIPLRAPTAQGLPNDQELAVLADVENALVTLLPSNRGILIAVITTSAMREFVLYVSSPDCASTALNAAAGCASAYDVQQYVARDADWSGYDEIAATDR
jgi:hypothetical protein